MNIKKHNLMYMVIVLLISPLVAQEPPVNDFPLRFLVREAYKCTEIESLGNHRFQEIPTCFMTLESGDIHYSVSQKSVPTFLKTCKLYSPGTELQGRINNGLVEIMYWDAKKRGKGEWKANPYHVDSSSTVQ